MVDFAKLRNQPKRTPPLVPRQIIGITGHRPHKLDSHGLSPAEPGFNGYVWSNPLRVWMREQIQAKTQALLDCATNPVRPAYYTDADYIANYLSRVRWQRKPVDPTQPIAVSGVALGVDTDACGVWYRMGVPYIALVPFIGQDSRWPERSQAAYQAVLQAAAGVYLCYDGKPHSDQHAKELLLARDEVLCCLVDELIAGWDGSFGGTAHTVRMWDRFGGRARLHRIDPREFRHAT